MDNDKKKLRLKIKTDGKIFTNISMLIRNIFRFIKEKLLPKKFNKRKFLWITGLIILVFFFIGAGATIGVLHAIFQNLPSIESLETYQPGRITYIYADNGEVIGEYALEKRIPITYEQIPEVLIQAIIATEDPRFYSHNGVDVMGILRAIKENLRNLRRTKFQGGSTITQQLIRTLFLTPRQTIRRKIKEWILALKVERKYSKEEILTLYCNQFYLGNRCYGVETLSQLFWNKSVSDLTLNEAALVAGIFRSSANYDPYKYPEITLGRRNHVLDRMAEVGFISQEESEAAKQQPIEILPLRRETSDYAAYFSEEVRQYLEENYGKDALYSSGLKVYTTLNTELQHYAEDALRNGLHHLDKSQGWRKDKLNLLDFEIENLEELEKPFLKPGEKAGGAHLLESWFKLELQESDIIEAVVLSAERSKAQVKIKDYTGSLNNRGSLIDRNVSWTETKNLKTLFKRGDIIQVRIDKIDEEKKELSLSLEQEPNLEGAFLAVNPKTGEIKALVGGYSFRKLKFNQATQAMRQSGSVIKPFLYTAALENGYTPSSIIIDAPTEFPDKWSGEIYAPPNYDEKYKGAITLRMALEQSRNVPTVRLLDSISPQTGVEYCKKFGISATLYPYLSLALGAFEVKLLELVSAFSTFPNKGVRIIPFFITRIEDHEGNILEETQVESAKVISPQTAYMMTSLLQGVIKRGSAWPAQNMEMNLGGKTGTTDDFSDAWFIGFSPSLCAGVWVGHHEGRITIGERKSGMVAALPIWREFFQRIIDDLKAEAEENEEEYVPEEFEIPPNLNFVEVDRLTGLLPSSICLPLYIIKEVYRPGTEPNRYCTYEDHMLTYDYYRVLRREDD